MNLGSIVRVAFGLPAASFNTLKAARALSEICHPCYRCRLFVRRDRSRTAVAKPNYKMAEIIRSLLQQQLAGRQMPRPRPNFARIIGTENSNVCPGRGIAPRHFHARVPKRLRLLNSPKCSRTFGSSKTRSRSSCNDLDSGASRSRYFSIRAAAVAGERCMGSYRSSPQRANSQA